MGKLKILHIAQFLGIGGLEKVLLLLAQEQAKHRHQVDIYIYDSNRDWVDTFRQLGLNVITPPLKSPGYDLKLFKRLEKLVTHYDVVHCHDLNPLMYLAPLKLSFLLRNRPFPKLVHTSHGMSHLQAQKKTRLYERIMAPLASELVGVSEHIADFYKGLFGTRPQSVHRIDNGIAIPSQRRPSDPLQRKKDTDRVWSQFSIAPQAADKMWIVVARIVPLKDQLTILRAARKLTNVQLIIVGPVGDRDYHLQLQKYKTDKIHFLGAQGDIKKLLAASDFFLSGSLHEGIPISVLEAMAQEVPCLLSNIPGHQILFSQSQSGVLGSLFAAGDEDDLIRQYQILLKSPTTCDRITANAYTEVSQHYSAHNMYLKYLSVYTRGENV